MDIRYDIPTLLDFMNNVTFRAAAAVDVEIFILTPLQDYKEPGPTLFGKTDKHTFKVGYFPNHIITVKENGYGFFGFGEKRKYKSPKYFGLVFKYEKKVEYCSISRKKAEKILGEKDLSLQRLKEAFDWNLTRELLCQFKEAPVDLKIEHYGPPDTTPIEDDHSPFLGSKWEKCGTDMPEGSQLLTTAELAKALKKKKEFTRQEWEAFGIKNLQTNDVVKVESEHFKPVAPHTTIEFSNFTLKLEKDADYDQLAKSLKSVQKDELKTYPYFFLYPCKEDQFHKVSHPQNIPSRKEAQKNKLFVLRFEENTKFYKIIDATYESIHNYFNKPKIDIFHKENLDKHFEFFETLKQTTADMKNKIECNDGSKINVKEEENNDGYTQFVNTVKAATAVSQGVVTKPSATEEEATVAVGSAAAARATGVVATAGVNVDLANETVATHGPAAAAQESTTNSEDVAIQIRKLLNSQKLSDREKIEILLKNIQLME